MEDINRQRYASEQVLKSRDATARAAGDNVNLSFLKELGICFATRAVEVRLLYITRAN